ncbi:hypothetical protein [Oceanithermus sp.]|uniref:hypothetical protein n=1 Tax=Oceanithermus sp. TaxID=2268145 RepID=UPI0026003C5E|nr:hypothetical protein [Oceanithermus sp.]
MLGINLKGALSDLLSSPEVKRILAWLEGKLNRLTDALAALERMLGYEHGLPVKDVPPHDPRRLPYVHRAEGVSDLRLNVAAALGKPATRGEIMNYGDTKALLVFIRSDGASEERVEYLLPSGTTLSPSWFYDALEIRDAGEGPVSVQVLAQ